jgi:hypothetical protein
MNCGNWFVYCSIHGIYLSLTFQCQTSHRSFWTIRRLKFLQLGTISLSGGDLRSFSDRFPRFHQRMQQT